MGEFQSKSNQAPPMPRAFPYPEMPKGRVITENGETYHEMPRAFDYEKPAQVSMTVDGRTVFPMPKCFTTNEEDRRSKLIGNAIASRTNRLTVADRPWLETWPTSALEGLQPTERASR